MQFPVKPLAYGLALIAGAGLLGACGGGSNNDGPRIQVSPANAYLLTSNNRIIGVDLDDTEFARTVAGLLQNTVAVGANGYSNNALDINEQVLDIDYRNAEGLLYGLTRVGTEGRIIIIDPFNGTIFRRGTLTADQTDMTQPFTALGMESYTIDFNPAVDKLRILGSNGTNLRVTITANSDATATVPTTPAATVVTDGNVNCGSACSTVPALVGAAYTDEGMATTGNRTTRLFGMDLTNTYALNANAGTVNTIRALGINGVSKVNGFDINPSNNQGVAILTTGGSPSAYTVDSSATGTGNAANFLTSLPILPGLEQYIGLSLVTGANPTVAP